MTSPLKAGVVGAGFVGSIHARALNTHPRVKLIGICGRTQPKTETLARAHGVPFFLSVEEMLSKGRPDAVFVCTGNKDHRGPSIEALGSGAHVFVEKPMAFTLEDARAMVTTAERTGLRLGVNFNHRFSAPFQKALAWAEEGHLGRISYLNMKFAGDLYQDLNDPYCQLIETQGHSFDLLRLFGGEIDDVFAFLADPRGIDVFTSAAVSMRFRTGAIGSLLGSWDSSYAHPGAQSLEVSGTEGRLQVENVVDAVRLFRHGSAEYQEWRPGLFDSRRRDFWQTIDVHVQAFVDAVLADKPPPVTGNDGLRALELTFAAIRSFEEGKAVKIHVRDVPGGS
jgi:predicted dehydrogenase